MPAHDRGTTKLDAYLVRILAAVVRRTKEGELRIKVDEVDAIDEGCILVKDFNASTGELVFRTGSRFNEVYRVLPEAPCQTKPLILSPTPAAAPEKPLLSESPGPLEQEQLRQNQERLGSTLKTNQELADLEGKFLRRRLAALVRQEQSKRHSEQQELEFLRPPSTS